MKKINLLFTLLAFGLLHLQAKDYIVKSPDGKTVITVSVDKKVAYSVSVDGNEVLKNCAIALQLPGETLGENAKVKRAQTKAIYERIRPVVPLKFAEIADHCNQLTLSFDRNFAIDFRAYDNGVAYRFSTQKKGQIDVKDECCELRFATDNKAVISRTGHFRTSCEETYSTVQTAAYSQDDHMTYLPIFIETPTVKLLFSESDLRDYPGMFLKGTGENAMRAVFPPCPLEFTPDGDRSVRFTKTADYIARTDGTRTFPWRFFVIAREDADIVTNTMEVVLGGRNEIKDPSWIKPGQVSWDWWNHKMIWNVDFVSGINNDTYKAYIDFASKYGIKYIILDEGWSRTTRDPLNTIDAIDLPDLISYGKQRGVGLVLWLTWLTVENNMELFAKYEEWGVAGCKIDFMDRQDQWMVNFYERVVKEAAKHHLLIDYHGAYKPSGLEQRYPNLLSYEGVRGLEFNGGCEPKNSIWLPFMRNAVGPMDFTPGAMITSQPEHNRSTDPAPMGNGTRAYQLALYIAFESGIQMLSDSPTRYLENPDCTEFIASVPVTWDETRVLSAKAGDHLVVAKRKDNKWFIGAITGDQPQDISVKLDFLKGNQHRMTFFQDGANAHRQAQDYKKGTQTVNGSTEINMHLVRNGGWCAVIE